MAERFTDANAGMIHEKSVAILQKVGFCVPKDSVLDRLASMDFRVYRETQMVRLTKDHVETALDTLQKDIQLYDRSSEICFPLGGSSYFMGAGTPVNGLEFDSG